MLQASGVAARAEGTSGRPGGSPHRKVRKGEEEVWLGCGGAYGQGQQLRESGFRSERRWGRVQVGRGGLPPPSDPQPCLVPGLPPGCEAWYGESQEDSRP